MFLPDQKDFEENKIFDVYKNVIIVTLQIQGPGKLQEGYVSLILFLLHVELACLNILRSGSQRRRELANYYVSVWGKGGYMTMFLM